MLQFSRAIITKFKRPIITCDVFASDHLTIIFAEGEVIIEKYSPRRSGGEYSPLITEPEANNCFSIFIQVFWAFLGLNLF
jgi:hypothetical protein